MFLVSSILGQRSSTFDISSITVIDHWRRTIRLGVLVGFFDGTGFFRLGE